MLKIDFHIHAFPDNVAKKAISGLIDNVKNLGKESPGIPCTDGTEAQTREKLFSYADVGVLMPIATRAGQQAKVNDWARGVAHDGIISFASVYPADPQAMDELKRIRDMGFFGVKLHPDYQGFDVDDESVFFIYEALEKLGLPVLFHAGVDPVSLSHVHCPPAALARVAKRFSGMTVIAAHLGASMMYEQSREHLLGAGLENLYVDCSMAGWFASKDQLREGIRLIGADRVLFATDLPWSDGKAAVRTLESLGLSREELEKIYYKNALGLLRLKKEDLC